MSVKVARRQFTVDDYYRMAEAGILGEDDRVELIEGEIVEMTPIGSHHAGIVDRLTALLSRALPTRAANVRVQNPIRLTNLSEPQPDLTLLRPRSDFYTGAHPGPADVLLVIEVADTSLDYDRDVKLGVYASAGIPEVWIVNLSADNVEVYAQPSANGYASQRVARRGQTITPASLPDLRLAIDDILG